jgi:hypothetical protein
MTSLDGCEQAHAGVRADDADDHRVGVTSPGLKVMSFEWSISREAMAQWTPTIASSIIHSL